MELRAAGASEQRPATIFLVVPNDSEEADTHAPSHARPGASAHCSTLPPKQTVGTKAFPPECLRL